MSASEKEPMPTSATTTATSYDDSSLRPRSSNKVVQDSSPSAAKVAEPNVIRRTTRRSKYRHVEAYHSELRHSSLSRDSGTTTNFLGFRNLMVIVLGRETAIKLGLLHDADMKL